MVRHKITTYAMLTPERRFQLQEDIRSRRAARVAAGMSPDSPGPEEIGEVEEVEGDPSELMQGVDPVGGDVMEEEEGVTRMTRTTRKAWTRKTRRSSISVSRP